MPANDFIRPYNFNGAVRQLDTKDIYDIPDLTTEIGQAVNEAIEIALGDFTAGPPGEDGADGAQGPPGEKGVNWKGPWDPDLDYAEDDGVSYMGSSWVAADDPLPGVSPPMEIWQAPNTEWAVLGPTALEIPAPGSPLATMLGTSVTVVGDHLECPVDDWVDCAFPMPLQPEVDYQFEVVWKDGAPGGTHPSDGGAAYMSFMRVPYDENMWNEYPPGSGEYFSYYYFEPWSGSPPPHTEAVPTYFSQRITTEQWSNADYPDMPDFYMAQLAGSYNLWLKQVSWRVVNGRSTPYNDGETVYHDGQQYQSTTDGNLDVPGLGSSNWALINVPHWDLLAAKGEPGTGAPGEPGPVGPPGPMVEGTGKALLGVLYNNPDTVDEITSAQDPTTNFEPIRASDLYVDFVAPPDGEVLIRYYTGGISSDRVGFMDGSTMVESSIVWTAYTVSTIVWGLTPGQAYHWKLAWQLSDGPASAMFGDRVTPGEGFPQPLTVEIWTTGPVAGATGAAGPAGPTGIVMATHGSDANYPRPDGVLVYWVGTVEPNNGLDTDLLLLLEA